jgi:uncharacterized membrane protein
MAPELATSAPAQRARLPAIDAARGVALAGRVLYRLIGDFGRLVAVGSTSA